MSGEICNYGAFKKDLDQMYMDKAQELTEQEYGEEWDFYDLPDAEMVRIYSRAVELVHENLMEQYGKRRKKVRDVSKSL